MYNSAKQPVLLIECKSPDIQITDATLDQAMRYNLILGVKYLLITNGLKQFVISVEKGKGVLLPELPEYKDLFKSL